MRAVAAQTYPAKGAMTCVAVNDRDADPYLASHCQGHRTPQRRAGRNRVDKPAPCGLGQVRHGRWVKPWLAPAARLG